MENDKQKDFLKTLNSLDPERLTREDFSKAFMQLMQLIMKMEQRVNETLGKTQELSHKTISDAQSMHASNFENLKGQVDQVFVGEKISEMKKLIDDRIALVKDGKNGRDGLRGERGSSGKSGSPDTPKIIVNKLESLEGEERLDASAIKGLEDFLKDLKSLKGRTTFIG